VALLFVGAAPSPSRIDARIRMPSPPFRIATGEGFVWVLNRAPTGCKGRCSLSRIDPGSNRLIGRPTPLANPWDLTVGGGSVWVSEFDGRVTRVDARTGRITARISARPLFFGSTLVFGGGFVWTANDDERNKGGSVSKIDPSTGRVLGTVRGLMSPQSIAFGGGAVWAADHAGALVKIDPDALEVVARQRYRFGPHGVIVSGTAVYVADAHAGRLLEADPATAATRRVVRLSIPPIHPVLGGGWIWASSSIAWSGAPPPRDDVVLRIDPATLRIAEVVGVGAPSPAVAFGFGSVWAATRTGYVVRITP
jgi:DNA-binding beta-propeller fold protein YncE